MTFMLKIAGALVGLDGFLEPHFWRAVAAIALGAGMVTTGELIELARDKFAFKVEVEG